LRKYKIRDMAISDDVIHATVSIFLEYE